MPRHFSNESIRVEVLKKRAYNFRWATVPEGVIPFTAADPDFPAAPVIQEALHDYVKSGPLSYGPAEGLPEFREAVARDLLGKGISGESGDHAKRILATDGAALIMVDRIQSRFEPFPTQ